MSEVNNEKNIFIETLGKRIRDENVMETNNRRSGNSIVNALGIYPG